MVNSVELLFKIVIYHFEFIWKVKISQMIELALFCGLFVCLRCLFTAVSCLRSFFKGAVRNRSTRVDATVLLKYRPYKTVQSPATVLCI